MTAAHFRHLHGATMRELNTVLREHAQAVRDLPHARRDLQGRAAAEVARGRAAGVARDGGAALALEALTLEARGNAAAAAAVTALSGLALRALSSFAQAAQALADREGST
jgi:hypothetical protein